MTNPEEESRRRQQWTRWTRRIKIGFWIFVIGACMLLLVDAHMWRVESSSGGLGYVVSIIAVEILFGPVALIWFIVELFVLAIWLRLVTKGAGIIAPFFFLLWINIATGGETGDFFGLYLKILWMLMVVFSFIAYLRLRSRAKKESTSGRR